MKDTSKSESIVIPVEPLPKVDVKWVAEAFWIAGENTKNATISAPRNPIVSCFLFIHFRLIIRIQLQLLYYLQLQ